MNEWVSAYEWPSSSVMSDEWYWLADYVGAPYRLQLDDPWNAVRLLSPDLGVFIMSLITMVLCKRLLKRRAEGSVVHAFHLEVGALQLGFRGNLQHTLNIHTHTHPPNGFFSLIQSFYEIQDNQVCISTAQPQTSPSLTFTFKQLGRISRIICSSCCRFERFREPQNLMS